MSTTKSLKNSKDLEHFLNLQSYDGINLNLDEVFKQGQREISYKSYIKDHPNNPKNLQNYFKVVQKYWLHLQKIQKIYNNTEKKTAMLTEIFLQMQKNFANYCCQLEEQFLLTLQSLHDEQKVFKNSNGVIPLMSLMNSSIFIEMNSGPLNHREQVIFYKLQVQSAIINREYTQDAIYTQFFQQFLRDNVKFSEIWVGQILFELCCEVSYGKQLWNKYFELLDEQNKLKHIQNILESSGNLIKTEPTMVVLSLINLGRYLNQIDQYQLSYVIFSFLRKLAHDLKILITYLPYIYYKLAKLSIILGLFMKGRKCHKKGIDLLLQFSKKNLVIFTPKKDPMLFTTILMAENLTLLIFLGDYVNFQQYYLILVQHIKNTDTDIKQTKKIHTIFIQFCQYYLNQDTKKGTEDTHNLVLILQIIFYPCSEFKILVPSPLSINIAEAHDLQDIRFSDKFLKTHKIPNLAKQVWSSVASLLHLKISTPSQLIKSDNQEKLIQKHLNDQKKISHRSKSFFLSCMLSFFTKKIYFSKLITFRQLRPIKKLLISFIQSLNGSEMDLVLTLLMQQGDESNIELLLKANIFIELSRPNDALIILTKLYGELLSQKITQKQTQVASIEFITFLLMGDQYFILDDYEKSQKFYQKSLDIQGQNGEQNYYIDKIYFNLGLMQKNQQQFIKSFSYFKQSFESTIYRRPSYYHMLIMVKKSQNLQLLGYEKYEITKDLFNQVLTRQQLDILVSSCQWNNIEQKEQTSCIISRQNHNEIQSFSSQQELMQSLYLEGSYLITYQEDHRLIETTNTNDTIIKSQMSTVQDISVNIYESEQILVLDQQSQLLQQSIDLRLSTILFTNRKDIENLYINISCDFIQSPKILILLDEMMKIMQSPKFLPFETKDFLKNKINLSHISTTLISKVTLISFKGNQYACKEITTSYNINKKKEYTDKEINNLSTIFEEVINLYKVLCLNCKYLIKLIHIGMQLKESLGKKYWTFYLLTDYVTNGTLEILSKKFDLNQKLKISIQIVQALKILHDNDLAHLDLKPQNILFDQEFNPILIDFGISQNLKESIFKMNCGLTLEYCAKEIQQGQLSKKSDIYSFGCILYDIFTELKPWQNYQYFSILNEEFQVAHQIELTQCKFQNIVRLIRRCTITEREDRCSLDELLSELNSYDILQQS